MPKFVVLSGAQGISAAPSLSEALKRANPRFGTLWLSCTVEADSIEHAERLAAFVPCARWKRVHPELLAVHFGLSLDEYQRRLLRGERG